MTKDISMLRNRVERLKEQAQYASELYHDGEQITRQINRFNQALSQEASRPPKRISDIAFKVAELERQFNDIEPLHF